MEQIRTYAEGPFTIYELTETATGSWIKVAPERGGMVIGFGVEGEELLYLDKETFLNPAANVRGGNPVLFPISGQLVNGAYEWKGQTYAMKNHGLARIYPWEVVSTQATDGVSIKLRLTGSEEMLASYPFRFELLFTYTLKEGTLHIEQEYRNLSAQTMPMYPGFHPYFAAKGKRIAYETDAKTYLDYNDMAVKPFTGELDLAGMVESAAFLDAKTPRISFTLPELGRRITMEYSDLLRYVVLWSVEGKDFVCVEPWMALTGELHRGEELVRVEPGETIKAKLAIRSARI